MKIYEFDDYKRFLMSYVRSLPKGGRGELGRISQVLGLHSTMTSQIFRGDKNLSSEQALKLAEYLSLSEAESDYLMHLVLRERAGTHALKKYHTQKIEQLKKRATELVHNMPRDLILSESDKAIYYSTWHYTAIQLAPSIDGLQEINAIAEKLKLPKKTVRDVIDFLLAKGLCIEKDGKLQMGTTRTHLEASSPFISRHHMNWRMKAIERHSNLRETELSYSAPLTISEADFARVRKLLVEFLKTLVTVVDETTGEKVACLNIDWFEV